jgi:thiamine-phosphate pyrophosphorylase
MLVTDRARTRGRALAAVVAEAVRGGAGIVQVREPGLAEEELGALVQRIREVVPAGTPLVVNGSVRLARSLDVGLHLPARHPPLGGWRPEHAPFGRSVHDERELERALAERVDYVVVGTVFETAGKPGARPAGLALVERVSRLVHPMPVFAIGGVTVSRVPAVIHAGAWGVAVVGALLEAPDPGRVAQAFDLALAVACRVERGRSRRGAPEVDR